MNLALISEVMRNVFTPISLICLAGGLIVGIIGGALPGISSSMTCALCLPLTYSLEPIPAFIMLVAIYVGATYGGGITATLCSTPGTNAAAATALDGYPLTQKGRGQEAVGMVTLASAVGGVFGAIVLLLLAPPVGRFSLKFVSPEYFLLTIFALTLVAPLSTSSLPKGIFVAAFGLLLGTFGRDGVTAVNRFTFGILQLEDGIDTVPALIGTFSVSQILLLSAKARKGEQSLLEDPTKGLNGKVLPPWKEIKPTLRAMGRSSVMGTLIGIVPAAGASVASWIGYTLGKARSKHGDRFGKGSFEALASSEAANNAACGGALIPMFTLGIPGSGVTAILMGGMQIHGLAPGGKLFTEGAPTIYSIFAGFLLANILLLVIGLAATKPFGKLALVPTNILCPIIFCLATVGSYSLRRSMVDVIIMLIFGVIGYLLRRMDFPTAPMILGFVLSDIAEKNYRRSLVLARGSALKYYFSRPICVVLMVLIVISLFGPVIVKPIKARLERSAEENSRKSEQGD